jgi:hypothetical protein
MPRVYTGTTIDVGGTKVKVKQILLQGQSDLVPLMKNIVLTARGWLQTTIPELKNNPDPKVAAAFNACFISPPDATAAMNTVRSVLQTVKNFIDGSFAVKVRADDDAYGYVTSYYAGRTHSKVTGVIQYDSDGDPIARRGEVHVDTATVRKNPVLATITLIHEACHKWGNLDDYDDKGYFNPKCTAYGAPGLTWQQALNNADSYAVFCYKVVAAKFNSVTVNGKSL